MATAFALAIVAYLASGMFLHLSYERYLWILMALAASAAWIGMHAPEPEEEPTEPGSAATETPRQARQRAVRAAYLRQT